MGISEKRKKRKAIGPPVNRAENVMTEELGKMYLLFSLL